MAAIVNCLAEPARQIVRHQWNLLCCFNSNVQKLGDEARKLEMARADLQMRVTTEENNARVILREVKAWLEDVDKIQLNMTGIEGEITNIQSSSGCLSVISRYSLSKKVIETTEVMKQLLENRNFGVLGQPTPPAAVPIPLGPMNEFESRKHIEEEIMRHLRDNNINMIGICGMGGVGKTTMAKKVMNRAREEDLFVDIVMADVSQQVDMVKIQQEIAEHLGLELKEKILSSRAIKLRTRLVGKRILIVLDDVWKKLKLKELGIPCEGGCKECTILLTSRDRDVFNAMDVQKFCEIQILCKGEAWSLFKEKAGACMDDQNLLPIAQKIAEECKGLPLALVTLGVALKNKRRKSIWEDALQQLKSSNPINIREVLEDVYNPLRVSYDLLPSRQAKSIFLLCCLFPEDHNIPLEDLTVYAMGLGMFEDTKNLGEARNRTCLLIEMLKSRFLLLEGRDEYHGKMHDVVRDVSIFIASEERHINCNDCTWISPFLRERIGLSIESKFPNLRLLLINKAADRELEINDNFFEGMIKLEVLSIESCDSLRSLPDTIRLLENLRTLILDRCRYLESISVVGELENLEILICRFCGSIKNLPEEMGRLTRLKLLEFSWCPMLKTIAPGVISRMVELEELKMVRSFDQWEAEDKEGKERKNAGLKELQFLPSLTRLEIELADNLVDSEQISLSEKLERFVISFGSRNGDLLFSEKGFHTKLGLQLDGVISLGDWINVQLLRNTEYLSSAGDGSNSLDLAKAQKMKSLTLSDCSTMKKLVNMTTSIDTTTVFPLLESLDLAGLPKLEELCDINGPSPNQGSSNSAFQNLKELRLKRLPALKHLWKLAYQNAVSNLSSVEIYECDSLRNLFSLAMAKDCLFQLESLTVMHCKKMEQVLLWNQEENQQDTVESRFHITFPKLKRLNLRHLPNLTAFYKGMGTIEFPLLTKMEIQECPNLKSLVSSTCSIESGNNQYNSGGIRRDHDNDESLHLFCGPKKVAFGSLKTLSLGEYSTILTLWCHQIPVEFFTGLGHIMIGNCGSIRSLFSSSIAQNLLNLRKLRIENCCEMVKVIEEDEEEKDACGSETTRLFPNLKILHLECLSKLKTFCEWRYALELPSLEEVKIKDCLEMERYSSGSLTTPNLKNMLIENVGIVNTIRLNDVPQVEELEFRSCRMMEQEVVLSLNEEEDEKRPTLRNLRNLGSIEFPLLTQIGIFDCTKLKSFVPTTCSSGCENNQNNFGDISHDEDDIDPSHLFRNPRLASDSLETLSLGGYSTTLTLWCHQTPVEFFTGLWDIMIENCGGIRSLFSSSIAQNLLNLRELRIENCCEMVKVIEEDDEEKDACGGETTRLFPNLKILHLECLSKLKSFCEWRYALELPSLEEVRIKDCPEMERYSLGSLTTPPNLKDIHIENVGIANTICLNDVPQVEELEFRSCRMMEQVVVLSLNEEENEKDIGQSRRRRHHITFPKLKGLSLWNLPNLTTFCKEVESIEFPLLTTIEITDCTKLKSFVPATCSSGCENNQNNFGGISHDEDDVDPSHLFCNPKVVFGSLEKLCIKKYNSSTLWCDQIPSEFFSGLKELRVFDCGNIRSLFSSLIARNLVNLQTLIIRDCHEIIKVIEEEEEEKDACGGETSLFPNLEWLDLWGLSKLKSFCHWECAPKLESLKWVYINNCPQMERFSLGFVTTPNLGCFYVNNEDIFKTKDLNGTLQQQ